MPYARQWIEDDDIEAVVQVLRTDWLTTGPAVTAFEEAFAESVGAKSAVAMSSGTAALHAAVFAVGIGSSDEVIVPTMTFAASANCVRYQGGDVVFVDIRPDILTADPACIEAAISARTRAIVTVDYAGQPSDLDEIRAIADKHGIVVIEDAAHALGATYRGGRIGSLANLTTFSMHPVKHVAAGEGGVVTTDDSGLASRLRLFRNHGITTDHRQRERAGSWYYEMVELGYNYRLTDIQSALGFSQLRKQPAWLVRRREIAARYTDAFSSIPETTPPTVLPDRESAWHLYVLQLNLDRLRVGRAQVFAALRAEHIGVNVHYIPVPWHPYYQQQGYRKGQWPVSENAYERMLSLPMFPKMSDRDIDDVIEACQKVIEAYRR